MQEVRELRIRAVIFKDADLWVAQCLEYDIGAQAPDITSLQVRLDLAIKAELTTSLDMTGVPFGGIDPAPARFHDLWDARPKFIPSHRMSIQRKEGNVDVDLAPLNAAA